MHASAVLQTEFGAGDVPIDAMQAFLTLEHVAFAIGDLGIVIGEPFKHRLTSDTTLEVARRGHLDETPQGSANRSISHARRNKKNTHPVQPDQPAAIAAKSDLRKKPASYEHEGPETCRYCRGRTR